jgi:biopolymer transport protein ExbD
LIVRLAATGAIFINQTEVPAVGFPAELQKILAGREGTLVFFAADGELPYEQVATFLDTVHQAGATHLGIVFAELAGQ